VGLGATHYVQWGFVSITIPNLVVLGLMIVTFAAAIALRLPQESDVPPPPKEPRG
jgi:hypothetical protein